MTSRWRSRKAPRSSGWGRRFSAAGIMFDPALSPARIPSDKAERGERSRMNVSPLDLRQQRFRKSFRGFDPIEVSSFLMAAADDYEQELRETDSLRYEM